MYCLVCMVCYVFFFKPKTAYEWLISDCSSDVCSSDLLSYFDGTHLFEHADPRQGFHPEWSSYIFNYGRNEVRAFLLSSARFWLDRYHLDGQIGRASCRERGCQYV